MVYCQEGDKPTIKYKFSGQNEKIHFSEYAPIDVVTKEIPVEGTQNYVNDGFGIAFRSGSCSGLTCNFVVQDYYIEYPPGDFAKVFIMPCGQTTFSNSATSINRGEIVPGQLLIVNPNQKCPAPGKKRCSIQVLYNNILVFSDQGDCPVSFSVQCGNCPPGTEEHKSPAFPGYCCLECENIASQIRQIAATVRGING